MAYTTVNKSTDYFNTKLYTGNGSTQSITGVGFQPDLVWIKDRDATNSNPIYDVIRGATKRLQSDTSDAESTKSNGLTSFDSDGFSVGSAGQNNANGDNIVAWNWLADNTSGSSNTDGSITSTVSANTTAGFSIVQYTGNSTSGATVGHGLGVVPKLIIVKTTARAGNWVMYHNTLGATKYMELNNAATVGTSTAAFNDTEPNSSVFSLGSWSNTNDNGYGMIAYCFAEKPGYSKFGSYTGNGSTDGPFVYTGFKPAFLLIKSSSYPGNWLLYDNKREIQNITSGTPVNANEANPESTATNYAIDFLSNGFKLRNNNGNIQNNNETMFYMAFGQSLVGSNNVPCTAI